MLLLTALYIKFYIFINNYYLYKKKRGGEASNSVNENRGEEEKTLEAGEAKLCSHQDDIAELKAAVYSKIEVLYKSPNQRMCTACRYSVYDKALKLVI